MAWILKIKNCVLFSRGNKNQVSYFGTNTYFSLCQLALDDLDYSSENLNKDWCAYISLCYYSGLISEFLKTIAIV